MLFISRPGVFAHYLHESTPYGTNSSQNVGHSQAIQVVKASSVIEQSRNGKGCLIDIDGCLKMCCRPRYTWYKPHLERVALFRNLSHGKDELNTFQESGPAAPMRSRDRDLNNGRDLQPSGNELRPKWVYRNDHRLCAFSVCW